MVQQETNSNMVDLKSSHTENSGWDCLTGEFFQITKEQIISIILAKNSFGEQRDAGNTFQPVCWGQHISDTKETPK